MSELAIAYRRTAELVPYERNARTHTPEQLEQLVAAIREFGWTNPVLVDEAGRIIAGHGRVLAASQLGLAEVPTICIAGLSEGQRRALMLADNKLALNAGWDEALLASELQTLRAEDFDIGLIGFSIPELEALLASGGSEGGAGGGGAAIGSSGAGALADRFLIPPFSVLNAREGWWQDRKRAWLALGIRSELGRGGDLLMAFNDEVVRRVAQIEEGSPLWNQVRDRVRTAIKASGLSNKQVDAHCGTNGMVGHWIGNSQPMLPTPGHWAKLKEILALGEDLDGPMLTTETVPGAETARRVYEGGGGKRARAADGPIA